MLSSRHLKVVNLYMKGMSKKEALKMAGYSDYTATHDAGSIFGREDVQKEIEFRTQKMVERAQLTEDWIVERLKKIADSSVGDLIDLDEKGQPFFNWKKMTPDIRKALADLDIHEYKEGRGPNARDVKKIRVRMQDQMKALELLGKYLGMWKEKVELTSEDALIQALFEGRKRVGSEEENDS